MPAVEFTVKDKETQEPIEGVELEFERSTKVLAVSDADGHISYGGVYDRKWHLYPFPIISGGQYIYSLPFVISAPQYNKYEFSCKSTSLSGGCFTLELIKTDLQKKDILFEYDSVKEICSYLQVTASIDLIQKEENEKLFVITIDEKFRDQLKDKHNNIKILVVQKPDGFYYKVFDNNTSSKGSDLNRCYGSYCSELYNQNGKGIPIKLDIKTKGECLPIPSIEIIKTD